MRPPPGDVLEVLLGRLARRHRLFGIVVFEFRQRELAAGEEVLGFLDCLRRIAEEPRHFGRALEMPLGIGFQNAPGAVHAQPLADAGEHVLQRTLFRRGVERVIGGEQRHAAAARHVPQDGKAAAVGAMAVHGAAKPERARRGLGQF